MVDLRVVAWVFLGLLTLAINLGACYIAWAARNAWKKPFRSLEMDSESMWEKVESHLGRISRAKRGSAPAEPRMVPPSNGEAAPISVDRSTVPKRSSVLTAWRNRNNG